MMACKLVRERAREAAVSRWNV